MKSNLITIIALFHCCFSTGILLAQNDTLTIELNVEAIQNQLQQAPNFKNVENKKSNKLITIPSLDGKEYTYIVYETVNMEEPLYSQYPSIRSYILINKENPSHTGRLSTGLNSLNIMTKKNGAREFIAPDENEKGLYKIFIGDFNKSNMTCGVDEIEKLQEELIENKSAQSTFSNGATLRTYRIAIATTGEFYVANGNNNAAVLAVVNNYLNLLNDIFEDELAVTFNLTGNNAAILFPNAATDGLDPLNRVNSSQTVINNTIGAANYDIGHTFHIFETDPPGGCCATSGVAYLGAICENNFKGGGWTGSTAGTPDNLFMSTLAHEVGHQFGANHSYYGTDNNCFQRSPGNGYEPGSGNSLMSYEGICSSHNITPEVSTLYFHNHSLDQMVAEMAGKACHTNSPSNNAIPVTIAPANKTIPRNTPFELVGSGTDADGDQVIFNWEEFDTDNIVLGQAAPAGNPNAATNSTTAPLFRSFDPSVNGHTRVFPTVSDLVDGTQTLGEILPSVSRNMKFRLTARDFKAGGGAISCDDVDITVDATMGPFDVTSQASATTWTANGSNNATVTWNVAGTNTLCSNVDILFSTDRGTTFPFTIASNVANNGSYTFTIPSFPTSVGRIKVKCSDNYFFDINLGDITLNSTCDAVSATFSPDTDITAIQGSSGLNLSLSPDFGALISTINGTVSLSDPSSSVATENGSGTCINLNGNITHYDSYVFQLATAGTIDFKKTSGPFGIVLTIYENNFIPVSPCANFVASSFNISTSQVNDNVVASLQPGISYTLVIGSFNGTYPTLPAAYSVTNSGPVVYDGTPPPSATFNYTYMAVNQATGIIAAVNANSNFISLAPGTYTVYGVSHENTSNINTYVGSTFASFQSDASLLVVCAAISLNDIILDIQSNGNCPPNYTGANALSGIISGTEDYETDGAIESSQLIQAGATINYDSGTSIKLEAPFKAPNSATVRAFIDGCGGTMLQTNNSEK